ncbi:isoliquiritigenin 2'-O-methyltransferase-like [Senna tora]|uniref:Isoliquiritigenin 2'-O-methyltransferase-like n=1 Tax=Senna tora TaxID=362788 RepID=A0A834X0J7_9FABA|nr:isoliquiritigenin 2'-O-methyltransferase-like [Senna tora]
MAFEAHHHHHEEEDDSSFVSAMLPCVTQIHSASLNAAIELNLFEIIARANGRHVSAIEVASQLPTSMQHQDLAFRLDRVLRLLATQSLLTCSYYGVSPGGDTQRERLYAISPIGKFFVGANHNSGCMSLFSSFMSHPPLVDSCFVLQMCGPALQLSVMRGLNFKDAIISEDTDLFKKVHGIPYYQYLDTDPKLNNLFNKSMADISFMMMKRILEIYKGFEGISTLVDVGGGIEHIGGDMFASVPKGDAIILKVSAICHNWSDESSIQILKKCYESLPENGKVIIIEFIMSETIEPSEESKLLCSLDNLMFLHNGRERTEKEYEFLCKQSGFSAFKVASRAFSILGVMEFYK